ncbi:MAG: pyroglutamyl-peptidase I [Hyphomicrobiaceae bacterium]|nr:MAG: pyroglutamyl-peptidase I [Hyphomicrobiaceae bacterium]
MGVKIEEHSTRAKHMTGAKNSRPARLLITGFGPFPRIPVNASSRLALAIGRQARARMPDVEVTVSRLTTSWRAAPLELERLLVRLDPDIALHFGVSSGALGFLLETVARNEADGSPDALGGLPGTARLAADGPAKRRSTFPARQILARLHELQLPASISRDAGRYLCNATLYRSLELAATARRRRLTGFIHIPTSFADASGSASSLHRLTFQNAVAGGLAIVAVCHAHATAEFQAA